ncbi:MAG: P-loop NTPase fold protein [Candidatus Endonucleobacter bathymodioli]|uniref:P-loop NTPase fold protein n=1 Tax=Candidatus Endonucleibacter bathymodioli TaxID=539814 RepID=A0AA90NL62_9GAMM|nr:P-loop NTPase fold protein [Candidatus Endonucleobacter bathymodioli]
MSTNKSTYFSSDRPIDTIEQDLLGMSEFSTDLATAISHWREEHSLVVALHGDWGSGKSSIKNMAVSYLKKLDKSNKHNTYIIEFAPWEWGGPDKIQNLFIKEISRHIAKNKNGQELSILFKIYSEALNITSCFPQAACIWSALVRALSSLRRLACRLFCAQCPHPKKFGWDYLGKSLSDIKKDINDSLSKEDAPSIVLIIDDLDRLTSDEVRLVFQLVKANLEFPKIVFLLLFQRDLVEEKLTDGKQSGSNYLEKIIQVTFNIPKLNTERCHEVLAEKIYKITHSNNSAPKMFDKDRWLDILLHGIGAYFNNLRDVYRYTSTLSFHFNLFAKNQTFEVDPVDLIAIECLRLFEPEVYNKIADSKYILTRPVDYNAPKEKFADILKTVNADKKEQVDNILQRLFMKNGNRLMGINNHDNFDKYFHFRICETDISHAELEEMLSLTDDSTKFLEFSKSLKESNKLRSALDQFWLYTKKIPMKNDFTYIKSLLDIGDILDKGFDAHHLMIGCKDLTRRLITDFLLRKENSKERCQLLLKCLKDSQAILMIYLIIAHEKKENTIFKKPELDKITTAFVTKLESMANKTPEKLITKTNLQSSLHAWSRWGNKDTVTSWLKNYTNTAENCVKLLKVFVCTAKTNTGDERFMKLDDIKELLPVEPIKTIMENINKDNYDPKGQEAIELFNNACMGKYLYY